MTTAYAITGNRALPLAFAVVGVVLGVFAVGYVAMTRHVPHAGAFYAYVGRRAGTAPRPSPTAWISLLAYSMVQVCLYGAIGAAVSPLVEAWVGVLVPWWVYALAAWMLVTVLGTARVDLNGTVLAVLLVAEVALIVVYVGTFLAHPAHGYSPVSWSPSELVHAGLGAACAIAVLGFTGFEASVVFAEESRNPRRTIPIATYVSLAVIAAVYGISAWAMAVATGPDAIIPTAREQGPDLVFALAATHLGDDAATVGRLLFATSIIAAMISFHNTVARYAFALGREGVLPRMFGRTSLSGAPRAGSLAQSATGLTVIIVFALTGADPVVSLFYLSSTTGALGVLILLVLAAMAVLGYFATDPRGEGPWRTRIAPALVPDRPDDDPRSGPGATTPPSSASTNSSPLRWGLPAVYAVTALGGYGYGLHLRAHRPSIYHAIGHGARAALATPTPTAFADLRSQLASAATDIPSEGPR